MIIDHVGFDVRDLDRARVFYTAALEPLGISIVMEVENAVGMGRGPKPEFWFGAADGPQTGHLHLALVAENRNQVREFHRAAIAAGAADNGEPGLRQHYHPDYYAAFVIDPDGNNLEAVCHASET